MSGSIKGITIEFRGDTTKLDKALRQVNNETKQIDRELRNVDKALKFNPTSVELWKNKQQLLTQKISETKDKLSLLKQQQKAMDDAGVDKQSLEYQKLQREIVETESKLKTFEGQLKQIGNVKLKAASEQFKQWGASLENAGRKMQGLSMAAAGVVTSLGAISYKAGKNADDLNTMSKVYGIGTRDLQKYKAAADLVDVSVETIAKSHVKLEKSMASAQSGTGKSAEAFKQLGVDVVDANGKLRNGDEVWNDTIEALGKVKNETERDALAMQLMGKSAAELNPLIEDGGETYAKVAETMKEYNLDFVDQETLDKANEFNDSLDTMKLIGSAALSQVGSQLAAVFAPALEKVVGIFGKVAKWLGNLNPKVLAVIGVIAAVIAGIAPVLILLGKLAFSISSIISLVGVIAPLIGGLAVPIAIAIAAITAIIAVGVLLYKNWDTIKAKAIQIKNNLIQTWNNIKTSVTSAVNSLKTSISNAWNGIKTKVTTTASTIKTTLSTAWSTIKSTAKTAWAAIKEAITSPLKKAKDTVSGIISKIKGFFPVNLGKILHFSLPKISVSGGKAPWGIGGKGTKPSFSVSWASHAAGGIFDRPTILGSGNTIHEFGEAGAEAIVPLDPFWKKMDEMIDATKGTTNGIVININGANSDPREIADEVRRVLIQEVNRRRLAWQ
jgi:phage-related minor tail protein